MLKKYMGYRSVQTRKMCEVPKEKSCLFNQLFLEIVLPSSGHRLILIYSCFFFCFFVCVSIKERTSADTVHTRGQAKKQRILRYSEWIDARYSYVMLIATCNLQHSNC